MLSIKIIAFLCLTLGFEAINAVPTCKGPCPIYGGGSVGVPKGCSPKGVCYGSVNLLLSCTSPYVMVGAPYNPSTGIGGNGYCICGSTKGCN